MKKLATAILLAILATASQAAGLLPDTMGLHLASVHGGHGGAHVIRGKDWNNINPGFYARWANGLTLGTYRNSQSQQTTYAGWTWQTEGERFAITLGVATGYGLASIETRTWACPTTVDPNWKCRQGVWFYKRHLSPLIAPSVRIPLTDKASVRLSAIPGRDKARSVLHLSFEAKL